jgi:hypothetical protein
MRFSRRSNELQVIEVFRPCGHTWQMETIAGRRRRRAVAISLALVFMGVAANGPASAGGPSPQTADAFAQYIRSKETADARTLSDTKRFLRIDSLRETERGKAYARLQSGDTLIESDAAQGTSPRPVPGGLIHDWIGVVFVPSVSIRQAIAVLQDYGRDTDYYRPQVSKSKLLGRSGEDFHVFLRLKQTHGITVVFDTEYDIRYTELDFTHVHSRSYSTRIAEVSSPGQESEHEAAPADDRGFLWRLYSYWRFYEANGGVYIQCNAISLTRDVPTGLGWIVRPFIEKIPRESLSFTLEATRKALAGQARAGSVASSIKKASQ